MGHQDGHHTTLEECEQLKAHQAGKDTRWLREPGSDDWARTVRHDLWGLVSARGTGPPGPRRSSSVPIPSPPPRTAAASSPQMPEAV